MSAPVYLYVEDDEMNRHALALVLTRLMGVESLYVLEDSHDFIARIKALPTRPDVFLLDVQVQPHDGFEMLRMLRSEEDFENARIIAVTASVMDDQVDRLRTSGFDGCIGKPLNLASLPDTLRRIVQGEKTWQIVG
jgi:CheY-like chemotaxis protein